MSKVSKIDDDFNVSYVYEPLTHPTEYRLLNVRNPDDKAVIVPEMTVLNETLLFHDEENIKKYYPDVNCAVEKHYNEWTIWVNEKHDKIKLTTFSKNKKRDVLNMWFVKGRSDINKVPSITIHPETGNIYTSGFENTIRCNNLSKIFSAVYRMKRDYKYSKSIRENLSEEDLSDNKYVQTLRELLMEKNPEFKPLEGFFNGNPLFGLIVNFFFYKKNIEMNEINLFYYFKHYPGTKRKRQKYFNMEEELLKKHGLNPKNKFLKKLVLSGRVDMNKLKWFVVFFGDNYAKFLNSITDKSFFYTTIVESDLVGHSNRNHGWNIDEQFMTQYGSLITKLHKENIIKIVNSITEKDYTSNFSGDLCDHIRMMSDLKIIFPNLEFRSQTYKNFKLEHSDYSLKQKLLRKKFITSYVYSENTISKIEAPITTATDDESLQTFYPYILKTENDYLEEGNRMKHCVGGYTYRENSIIISVRNEDDTKRVTCEYHISDGKLIQERYVHNAMPPEEFIDALALLYVKVTEMAKLGTLNWIKKETVPNVVNGVVINDLIETLPNDNPLVRVVNGGGFDLFF